MRGLRTGVAIALTALLVGGAGAYAQSQITSAQIRNNTITSADIKNKSITTGDLSTSAVRSLQGKQGPAGPAGPAGATVQGSQVEGPPGPRGLQGPAGADGSDAFFGEVGFVGEGYLNNADGNPQTLDVAVGVATCPDGEELVNGGYYHDVVELDDELPPRRGEGHVFASFALQEEEAWLAGARNLSDSLPAADRQGVLEVYVDCVPSPDASKVPYAARLASAQARASQIAKGAAQRR